ncbi:nitrate- and nitrite sensing domain-containing protein [Stutzerimonas marianensis]|uniref:nitrate- and nitrite sensing domain-containing protein n=2 Tax=Stutzerimonas marianensis TaxID=2929513 RepID=UPI003C2D5C49
MHGRKMPATLRFMLAARRSELLGLEDLTTTCELVTRLSRLIHALQKERGYSNVYLSGGASKHAGQLDSLSLEADALHLQVSQALEKIEQDASGADKTRLFTRIAYALHALDDLPRLRRRVRDHDIGMQAATHAMTRLIGGLLAVIFEAADTASNPEVTRSLVALFNFMQGKELAGQERALGVHGFASGCFSEQMLVQWEQVLDHQARCFETFSRCACPAALALWHALSNSEAQAQAYRLRDVVRRAHAGAPVDASLCDIWFELQTARIDAMKTVEARLELDLQERCQQSIARIRRDLYDHRRLLDDLVDMHAAMEQTKLFTVQRNDPQHDGMTTLVSRTTLELLQAQTQRLQETQQQLREARQSLDERRLIEQAKQLLIHRHKLDEGEAYAMLRQSAMRHSQCIEDVARRLLATAGRVQAQR